MFDAEALNAALAQIPASDNNAVVLGITQDGVKLSVYLQRHTFWEVRAIYEHNWSGPHSAAGEIIFHWA